MSGNAEQTDYLRWEGSMKRSAWKYVAGGAVFLVAAVGVALFLPLKTVSVEVIETYYVTETRQEPYVAIEEYEIKTPHSAAIFEIDKEYLGEYFLLLFHRDTAKSVQWCRVMLKGNSLVETITLKATGQNHRIRVIGELTGRGETIWWEGGLYGSNPQTPIPWEPLVARLRVGRSPAAIEHGFRQVDISPEGLKPHKKVLYKLWAESQIPEIVYMSEVEAAGYRDPDTSTYYPKLGSINGTGIEFYFDEMFERDSWALIEIGKFGVSSPLTMSVDYVWDDVEIGTREVTKYREVPVEVEKQKTVTKYEKASIWELLLGADAGNEYAD